MRRCLECLGVIALVATLGACASGGDEKINYGAPAVPALEVPPDLVKPEDHTPVVDLVGAQSTVAPDVAKVEVRQDGAIRWLEVAQSPEVVWSKLREFFLKTGLKIAVEDPTLGIMETEWAENRANLNSGFFQRTLGKVMPSLFSNNGRDRYRARVERGESGSRIFLTHRGMEEVLVGGNSAMNVTQSAWQRRPADLELEAEMLRRLMLALGAPAASAQAVTANKPAARARLNKEAEGTVSLTLTDRIDSAWLRVGVALDRLGYVVKSRDDRRKTFLLRYVDPAAADEEKGIWAGGGESSKTEARDVSVQLTSVGDVTELRLLAGSAPLAAAQATPMLQALESQLQ